MWWMALEATHSLEARPDGDLDESDTLPPVPGLRLGAYELVLRIGTGGMGEVWVARHAGRFGFRSTVAGTAITHWWDNGNNAIAFSRGDKGFVAINRESTALIQTITTGLAAGTYCDRLTGGKDGAACAGTSLVVDGMGAVQVNLASNTAIAVDVTTKL